jgi:hypothetical protein
VNFADPSPAYAGIKFLYSQFPHFFRIRAPFRLERVNATASLAFAPLSSRTIASEIILLGRVSAFWTNFAFRNFCRSHIYIIPLKFANVNVILRTPSVDFMSGSRKNLNKHFAPAALRRRGEIFSGGYFYRNCRFVFHRSGFLSLCFDSGYRNLGSNFSE